jgi:hypothetical protein
MKNHNVWHCGIILFYIQNMPTKFLTDWSNRLYQVPKSNYWELTYHQKKFIIIISVVYLEPTPPTPITATESPGRTSAAWAMAP